MTSFLETAQAVGAVIGPFAGCAGVWAYFTARHKHKVAAPAAMLASQADLVEALNTQTKVLLNESAKDRRDLKRRIDRQGQKITRLEGQVAHCQEKHSECETNLTQVRAQIDQMMREGAVATYPHGGANVAD